MPIGVGIDLVSVRDFRSSVSTYGDRYLNRVYTQRELADCSTTAGVDPKRLAARFAAKEATFKALRPGDEAVPWRDIEVRDDDTGSPSLKLRGRAATLAAEGGVLSVALSLTNRRGCALAVVVAELAVGGR